MKKIIMMFLVIFSLIGISSCIDKNENSDVVIGGYSEENIAIENVDYIIHNGVYMGGYKQGQFVEGIYDSPYAKAFYLSYYGQEVLMISIDAIGITSDYVAKIRKGIKAKCKVNVMSTHTHASFDTIGLWGPIGEDGKKDWLMDTLVECAVKAGNDALNNAKEGKLTYGKIKTEGILIDSRKPYVYDENLYQLRFIPSDESKATRMVFYGAHAESLRGDNTYLSADFPAYIAMNFDDNFIFFNGAIGGLILTKTFHEPDMFENMLLTAKEITKYIKMIEEIPLTNKTLKQTTINFKIELDNIIYKYYKFLGILNQKVTRNIFTRKYYLRTEMSLLQIGGLNFVLIPGEIFYELVSGEYFINEDVFYKNPECLSSIGEKYGINDLIIIGLANDEIGYIVPPSDFMLNKESPYLNNVTDRYGENHYEETNSPGLDTAYKIASNFEKICKKA